MAAATLQTTVFMSVQEGVPIVYGSIDLARQPTKKGRGLPLAATVNGVVFLNDETTKADSLVLHRAVKGLPSHLKKLDGWEIVGFHVDKHLGYSITRKTDNGAV